jgi:hypothetical protein
MPPRKTSSAQLYEVRDRVKLQASARPAQRDAAGPLVRPLRIFTLDPSVSARLGGIATVQVPYEKLELGPKGALFAVECGKVPSPLKALPLDLDTPDLLLSGGLTPTPANGQFHLQMVYAVGSLTYAVFKRALGREICWAIPKPANGPFRLTLRPFGFRGKNAGFNRHTGDISFGFFEAGKEPAGFTVRGGLISTALSHDIIVHETTHALLDGLRESFLVPANVDVPAFHEAFADVVALLLHFSYTEMVEQAIRESGQAFIQGSLLTDLAREFGYARSRSGRGGALRSGVDVDGVAAFDSDVAPSKDGAPTRYDPDLEPHALGSVLVSAIFEAFATIVRRKTDRLFRIAGLDPKTSGRMMNDELVKAVASDASAVAHQFLDICIRAVDYCPPADMELGEYLRALITADADVERIDKWGFREALMRSFRRRHIFPDHVSFMTEDAVRWQPPETALQIPGLAFRDLKFEGDPGRPANERELERQAHALGRFVTDPAHASTFHLVAPAGTLPKGVTYAGPPAVQSIRVARRAAPDGRILFDIVAEVTQSCTVQHRGTMFDVNGGCTIVIDPYGQIRYAIYKKFDSEARRERQLVAMKGPLHAFWQKKGRQFTRRPDVDVLRRLHATAE